MNDIVRNVCYAASVIAAAVGVKMLVGGGDEAEPAGAPVAVRRFLEPTPENAATPLPAPSSTNDFTVATPARTEKQAESDSRRWQLEQTLEKIENSAVYVEGIDEAKAIPVKRLDLTPGPKTPAPSNK